MKPVAFVSPQTCDIPLLLCSPIQTSETPVLYSTTSVHMAKKPEAGESSRRAFVRRSIGITISSTAAGGFVNFDGHSDGCHCSSCSQSSAHEDGCSCGSCNKGLDHSLGCQCGDCMRFGPLSAAAYERDVGDNSRSAATFALNQQARETNSRLEASGFKLDTKEEESKRLDEAFASFSYDSVSSTKGQKSQVGKGYKEKK